MPDSVNGETQQSMQMYQHHLLSGGLSQYQPSGTMKPGSFLARQQPENYGCILHHQNMSSSLAQAAMPTETAFDSTLMQRQHFNSANPTVNLPFPADLSSLGGSVATSSAADALAKGAAAGTQSGEQAGNDESELVSKKRAKQNNDRNEHARSARERKKAYILKLRLLAERLHAERNEEAEKQRESIQQSTEVKRVRCKVVQTFLRYHSLYESDEQKWNTILEGDFCLKQPVTPFRSFRRAEIDKVRSYLKALVHFACTLN